jgi:regulation of enolase protein 1 (concanavalin A-like superfamily)
MLLFLIDHFIVCAQPNTILGDEPAHCNVRTAPILLKSSERRFTIAEVTVNADWKMDRDQGGLVVFGARQAQQPPVISACKWLKVGLERCYDELFVTCMYRTSDGADQAFNHLSSLSSTLRVKLERKDDNSLWVWYETHIPPRYDVGCGTVADVGDRWWPLRRIIGFFKDEDDDTSDVGVYASRPGKATTNNLEVEFKDLMILYPSDTVPDPCSNGRIE